MAFVRNFFIKLLRQQKVLAQFCFSMAPLQHIFGHFSLCRKFIFGNSLLATARPPSTPGLEPEPEGLGRSL